MSATKEAYIQIDATICTGCQRCQAVCPTAAIGGEAGAAQTIDAARCVMCGQCVQICSVYTAQLGEEPAAQAAELAARGSLPGLTEPLFAAHYRGQAREVQKVLAQPGRWKVVQCAPAVRVALAEDFGLPLGSLTPGRLAAALRRLGFQAVYDTNFAADVTIMEEGTELLERIKGKQQLPMFTSCCPAWVRFVETDYPDLVGHLSSCKSPQQMAGALFKTYGAQLAGKTASDVYSVAVMPCTCKAAEAARPEMNGSGCQDVDAVLTTRELAQFIKAARIDFTALPEEAFDQPLGEYSGAGQIFGASGGVMEAALRTAVEVLSGQPADLQELAVLRQPGAVKRTTLTAGDVRLNVVVAAGLTAAAPFLEAVRRGEADFDFMEVMCCPAGCVSGGGQPKLLLPEDRPAAYAARQAATYRHDAELPCRQSHANEAVAALYRDFLGQPLGEKSHHLLHTHYQGQGGKGRGAHGA